MTSIDISKNTGNFDSTQQALETFLWELRGIADRGVNCLDLPIFEVDKETQQALVDKLKPRVNFELSQAPELQDASLEITGEGMMYICSEDGTIIGAEIISYGDVVTGNLDDACVLPVPTTECILMGNGISEIPIIDETLSGVIVLKDAVYKTGVDKCGQFEVVHQLGVFTIGLPIAHYLKFKVDKAS